MSPMYLPPWPPWAPPPLSLPPNGVTTNSAVAPQLALAPACAPAPALMGKGCFVLRPRARQVAPAADEKREEYGPAAKVVKDPVGYNGFNTNCFSLRIGTCLAQAAVLEGATPTEVAVAAVVPLEAAVAAAAVVEPTGRVTHASAVVSEADAAVVSMVGGPQRIFAAEPVAWVLHETAAASMEGGVQRISAAEPAG